MNLYKKLIISYLPIGVIMSTTFATTSCTLGFESSRTMVVGAADYRDGSFNEDIYKGATAGDQDAKWVIAQDNSTATLEKTFRTLIAYGAKTIVAAGAGEKTAVMNSDGVYENVKYILVDEVADWENLSQQVTAIHYEIYQAAFLVGYQISEWAEQNKQKFNNRKEINVSGWGGADYTAVGNYLTGLRQGIEYHNTKHPSKIKMKWILFDENNRKNNFSGGWSPGANNAYDRTLAQTLIVNKKVDILLPVAASQTQTALKISADSNNRKTYVIGVDSDMRNVYPNYKDILITSILKNSSIAVRDAVVAANLEDPTLWEEKFGKKTYNATVENQGVWYVLIDGVGQPDEETLEKSKYALPQSQDCDWATFNNWCNAREK